MRRRAGALALLVPAAIVVAALIRPIGSAAAEGRILAVPGEFATPDAAIAAAQPGDVVLLDSGIYPGGYIVPEDKPGITIRGTDRNGVILDGQDMVNNAIEVEADGVTLANMTAHNFVENGFYWDGVTNYAGRYLTVWNVGLYGIYAISSRGGVIEHSHVSGAADAAFYIGECNPCDATVRNVTAVLSAVGYSGTNAGGNLIVETSRWDRNGVGILPNSFDVGLQPPPQAGAVFRANVVTDSGTVPTPRNTPLGGYAGIGIGVLGGVDNAVTDNDVTASARYGIAVLNTVDRDATWVSARNRISGNRVRGSGTADLALALGAGLQNCFDTNTVARSLPVSLANGGCSAEGAGDAAVAAELVLSPPELLAGLPDAPDYRTMPPPDPQLTMPARLAGGVQPVVVQYLLVVAVGAAIVVAVVRLGRRRGTA